MRPFVMALIFVFLTHSIALCWENNKQAQTLKAAITSSIDEARQDSFSNLSRSFDISSFPGKDPNYIENLLTKAKGLITIKDRFLTFFEDGSYAVYKKNQTICLYYRPNGHLFKVGQSAKPRGQNIYPNRDVEYDAQTGTLQSVGLYLSSSESFLFDTNGSLMIHWKYQDGYNEAGQIILKRKWVERNAGSN